MSVITGKRKDGSKFCQLCFHDENGEPLDKILTKQSFVKECDINTVVRRFRKTGILPQPTKIGQYGDFSNVGSFQDAMIKVVEAENSFLELPAKLREQFDNDVSRFVEFVDNPDNLDKLKEMGLVDNLDEIKPENKEPSDAMQKEGESSAQ